jgi:hypothetical protein
MGFCRVFNINIFSISVYTRLWVTATWPEMNTISDDIFSSLRLSIHFFKKEIVIKLVDLKQITAYVFLIVCRRTYRVKYWSRGSFSHSCKPLFWLITGPIRPNQFLGTVSLKNASLSQGHTDLYWSIHLFHLDLSSIFYITISVASKTWSIQKLVIKFFKRALSHV